MGFITSPHGEYQTPDQNEVPNLGAWLADIAEQVEANAVHHVKTGRVRIASGVTSISLSAASSGVAFADYTAAGFTQAPVVIVTPRNSSYSGYTAVPGLTACTVGARHVDNTSVTVTLDVQWIAIGVA